MLMYYHNTKSQISFDIKLSTSSKIIIQSQHFIFVLDLNTLGLGVWIYLVSFGLSFPFT